MPPIANISENTWILIIGQLIIGLGMVIKAWSDANNRIQDRLDRESLAKLTQRVHEETRQQMKDDGQERIKQVIETVKVVEKKADEAYNAGNGNQEKFAEVAKILKVHSDALSATPTQVEIINDVRHPVPVKENN